MSFIFVPPSERSWPPAGRPVAGFDTYAEAQLAARALHGEGIPADILHVAGWRSPGDWVAALSGVGVLAMAVILLAATIVESIEPWQTSALVVIGLACLAVALTVAVSAVFRRRARRFLAQFEPPVTGRHVLLSAPETVQAARDLLAARQIGPSATAD